MLTRFVLVVRKKVFIGVHVPDVLFVGPINALVHISAEPLGVGVHKVAGAVGSGRSFRTTEALTLVHGRFCRNKI